MMQEEAMTGRIPLSDPRMNPDHSLGMARVECPECTAGQGKTVFQLAERWEYSDPSGQGWRVLFRTVRCSHSWNRPKGPEDRNFSGL